MLDSLALIALIAPAGLAAVAIRAHARSASSPALVFAAARRGCGLAFGLAVAGALTVATVGPLESPVIGVAGVGLAIRLDALSLVMFALVTFVAAILVRFSRNYLDGDPRQAVFVGGLCLTVAAVLMLVLAGNLFQLVAAWIATSLALHRLLVFYPDRPGAVTAARKKFVVARLGDVCLLAAALLIWRGFGTAELSGVLAAARHAAETGVIPAGIGTATLLVVAAAALKSAMFPTHGWLLEVMETPTPVSALLHAGLINAGTFLVVRLGDVVLLQSSAQQMLLVIGGATALIASIAMIAQSSVKVSLAYSSSAHMGFMLFLCGLGAHAAAILHLVAHSFYKAHAFLSSGSVVEYVRGIGRPDESTPSPISILAGMAGAFGLFVALGTLLGVPMAERPASMALGAIFVMAITHLLARSVVGTFSAFVVARTALSATLVTLAFFVLEAGTHAILDGAIGVPPTASVGTRLVMLGVVAMFASVVWLQMELPARARQPRWRAMYVHFKNGFYANTMFDRLIGSFR